MMRTEYNAPMVKKLCVVKLGSAAVTDASGSLDYRFLRTICQQIVELRREGWNFVLVSSGAMVSGRAILAQRAERRAILAQRGERNDDSGVAHRISDQRRVFSAIGQSKLISEYEKLFSEVANDLIPAQVLLTRQSLADRGRFIAIRETLIDMISNNVIPIVNGNDATNSRTFDFYDNDQISSYIAGMLNADKIVFITDIDGVYNKNPKLYSDAARIETLPSNPSEWPTVSIDDKTSSFGGMTNKLQALRLMCALGIAAQIASKKEENVLLRCIRRESDVSLGTKLSAMKTKRLDPKKRWLYSGAYSSGILIVSGKGADALRRLSIEGKSISLLAVGVVAFHGSFDKSDVVTIRDDNFTLIGVGICRFSARELDLVLHELHRVSNVKVSSPIVVHASEMVAAEQMAFVDQNDRQLVRATAEKMRSLGYVVSDSTAEVSSRRTDAASCVSVPTNTDLQGTNTSDAGRRRTDDRTIFRDRQKAHIWQEAIRASSALSVSKDDWLLFRQVTRWDARQEEAPAANESRHQSHIGVLISRLLEAVTKALRLRTSHSNPL